MCGAEDFSKVGLLCPGVPHGAVARDVGKRPSAQPAECKRRVVDGCGSEQLFVCSMGWVQVPMDLPCKVRHSRKPLLAVQT